MRRDGVRLTGKRQVARSFAAGQLAVRLTALAAVGGVAAVLSAPTASAHPHVWVSNRTTVVYENGAITALRYTWLFDESYSSVAVEDLPKTKDGGLEPAELEKLARINIEGLKEFDYFTSAGLGGKPVEFGEPRQWSMEVMEVDEAPGPQMVAGPAAAPPGSGAGAPAPGSPNASTWSMLTAAVAGWWSRLVGGQRPQQQAQAQAPASAPSPPAEAAKGTEAPRERKKLLAMHFTLPLKLPVLAEAKGFQFMVHDPGVFIWFELAAKDPVRLEGAPEGCKSVIGEPELDEEQKRLNDAFGRTGGLAMVGPSRLVTLSCPDR